MAAFKAFRLFNEDGKVAARFVDMTLDELDPGEVVVRTEWSSINYKDALAATGAGKIIRRFPCVGGIDGAGVVEASSSPDFKPGDRVTCNSFDVGVAHDGGYAERMRIPAQWVVKLPDAMSTFDAAVLGVAGFTAGLAVVRMEAAGLAPGHGPVIVDGATGGVGSVAIDLLAQRGYRVVALTGKEAETDYLKSLGAAEVLLRSSLDLAKIRPLGSETWAGAVDNLGGDVLSWMTSTMKTGGVIAVIGLAASHVYNTTVMPFILRGVTLCGIDSVNCPMPLRRQVWQQLATTMRPKHLATVARTIGFDALPGAFPAFVQGAVKGRTVVKIG
jgi:putative YhdH/YhfP family quinone oxidoreductase